jgi:hypothetical protein
VGLLKAKLHIITDKKVLHFIEEKERESNVKKENSTASFKALIKVLQHMF